MNKLGLAAFTMTNMIAAAGFAFIAVVVMPRMRLQWWVTKVGGIGFFLAVAAARAEVALHALDGHRAVSLVVPQQMAIAVAMAIFVWMAIFGLYRELVLGFTNLNELVEFKELTEATAGLHQSFEDYVQQRHQQMADAVQGIWGLSAETNRIVKDIRDGRNDQISSDD